MRIRGVRRAVRFSRDGDHFTVQVPAELELSGVAIADGSCCSQPENRWYTTFDTSLRSSVVGVPDTCWVTGTQGIAAWEHPGENNVQLASFR